MSSWDDVTFEEPFDCINQDFMGSAKKNDNSGVKDTLSSSCSSPTHILGGVVVTDDFIRSFSLADNGSGVYDSGDGKSQRGVTESVSRNDILWLLKKDIGHLSEQQYISEHDAELLLRQNQYDVQAIHTAVVESTAQRQSDLLDVSSLSSTVCYVYGLGCTREVLDVPTIARTTSMDESKANNVEVATLSFLRQSSTSTLDTPHLMKQTSASAISLRPRLQHQSSSHQQHIDHQCEHNTHKQASSLLSTYFGSRYTEFQSDADKTVYEKKVKYVSPPSDFVVPHSSNTQWFITQQDAEIWKNKGSYATMPSLFVQCSSAYCDIVPYEEASSLQCGHWFCNSCWQAFLQNEHTMYKGQVLSTKCMGYHCVDTSMNHSHGIHCKCSALLPVHFQEYFIFSDMTVSLHTKTVAPVLKWVNPSPLVWHLVNRFVQYSKTHKVRWCSNPLCVAPSTGSPYALVNITGIVSSVTCKCGWEQCFKCGDAPHMPAPCDQTVKWKNFTDNSTDLWLLAKTKPCPKCKVRIEKNRACNHMNCLMCKHEFCWLCLGSWKTHGGLTGGYFNCTVYNTQELTGRLNEAEKDSRRNNEIMHKYNYYFNRYAQHDQGKQFTLKLREQLQECLGKISTFMLRKIALRATAYRTLSEVEKGQAVINITNANTRNIQLMYHARIPKAVAGVTFTPEQTDLWNNSQSGREELMKKYQLIFEALDMLVECRSILRWSFVVSYYIRSSTEDGKKGKKQLFEMQQNMLVEPTENQQQILEGLHLDLVKVLTQEIEIRQHVANMRKLKDFITGQVQSGAFESALMYEADLELTQAWTCSCGANNDANGSKVSLHCRKCGNCKLHDEPDCKICIKK